MKASEEEVAAAHRRSAALVVVIFVLIVVVSYAFPRHQTACILAGLLAIFAVEWRRQWDEDAARRHGAGDAPRDGFYAPPPGAPAPYAVSAGAPLGRDDPAAGAAPRPYPGAIDVDEYDSDAAYGHRDRTEGDAETAPDGNPYNPSRVASPEAAGPEVDDEANDDNIDGDERMNYQALSRNDPTRAEAGIMNRRKELEKYFDEELETAEERQWWGRHEI